MTMTDQPASASEVPVIGSNSELASPPESRGCSESPVSSTADPPPAATPSSSPPTADSAHKFVAPRRPALGVEGRTISLRANHLEVSVRPGYIYQHRVSIMPGQCKTSNKRAYIVLKFIKRNSKKNSFMIDNDNSKVGVPAE